MKKLHQISKTLLAGVIVGLAIINAGCSFKIGFNIKNLTDNAITVNYILKGPGAAGFSPRLVLENHGEDASKYLPLPEDRIRIETEKCTVEFELLPNENVELYWVGDRRENDYEKEFNLVNLRIIGADGSRSFEGREVFKSFLPIRKNWYTFGPDITGFVLEYR